MKHRTATLEGPLLDAAVALALGWKWIDGSYSIRMDVDGPLIRPALTVDDSAEVFDPSESWAIGGPIIDRHGICIVRMHRVDEQGHQHPAWFAWVLDADQGAGTYFDVYPGDAHGEGPTYLIAAMRAYVASKFGDEVELP